MCAFDSTIELVPSLTKDDVNRSLRLIADLFRRGKGLAIAVAIKTFLNWETATCFPCAATIAKRAGCCREVVQDWLNRLQLAGLLTITHRFDRHGRQRSSTLQFCLPKPAVPVVGVSAENDAETGQTPTPKPPNSDTQKAPNSDTQNGQTPTPLTRDSNQKDSNQMASPYGEAAARTGASASASRRDRTIDFSNILLRILEPELVDAITTTRRKRGADMSAVTAGWLVEALEQTGDAVRAAKDMVLRNLMAPIAGKPTRPTRDSTPKLSNLWPSQIRRIRKAANWDLDRGLYDTLEEAEKAHTENAFGLENDYSQRAAAADEREAADRRRRWEEGSAFDRWALSEIGYEYEPDRYGGGDLHTGPKIDGEAVRGWGFEQ
jgi:hypothetical protein